MSLLLRTCIISLFKSNYVINAECTDEDVREIHAHIQFDREREMKKVGSHSRSIQDRVMIQVNTCGQLGQINFMSV